MRLPGADGAGGDRSASFCGTSNCSLDLGRLVDIIGTKRLVSVGYCISQAWPACALKPMPAFILALPRLTRKFGSLEIGDARFCAMEWECLV